MRCARGAVTVEWATLTAGAAALALGVVGPLRPALDGVTGAIVAGATALISAAGWGF